MKKIFLSLMFILSYLFAVETNITAQINIKKPSLQEAKKTLKNPKNTNNATPSNDKVFLIKNNKKETKGETSNQISIIKPISLTQNFQSTYTVQDGDTLGSIAIRFDVAQGEIQRLNADIDLEKLKIGQTLFMPISQQKIDAIVSQEKKEESLKPKQSEDKYLFTPSGNQLRVIASAYTSHVNQISANPFIAAWGDRLSTGMKIIAVSRDLISQYGLTNGSKVKISGLDGYYVVKDKMNKRYIKHIDIYMGLDRGRAIQWGRRSVIIYW